MGVDARLFLKLETLQHTGSFKPRGALNRLLLASPLPEAGVVAASDGNHGAAVARAARRLGAVAEVFVPELCPAEKLVLMRRHGAKVTVDGRFYADALAAEPSGATALAPLLSGRYAPEVGERVGVVVCGANTDPGELVSRQTRTR